MLHEDKVGNPEAGARGWINYYRYADMKSLIEQTDEWSSHRTEGCTGKGGRYAQDIKCCGRYIYQSGRCMRWRTAERRWRAAGMPTWHSPKRIIVTDLVIPGYDCLLSESPSKLLNRVVPNGTLRGCGEVKIPLSDLVIKTI